MSDILITDRLQEAHRSLLSPGETQSLSIVYSFAGIILCLRSDHITISQEDLMYFISESVKESVNPALYDVYNDCGMPVFAQLSKIAVGEVYIHIHIETVNIAGQLFTEMCFHEPIVQLLQDKVFIPF